MKLIYFLLSFLFFAGIFLVISNQNLNLLNKAERSEFLDCFQNWLSKILSNSKGITNYVISLDWAPDAAPNNSWKASDID